MTEEQEALCNYVEEIDARMSLIANIVELDDVKKEK
jgi:hypothetical protein